MGNPCWFWPFLRLFLNRITWKYSLYLLISLYKWHFQKIKVVFILSLCFLKRHWPLSFLNPYSLHLLWFKPISSCFERLLQVSNYVIGLLQKATNLWVFSKTLAWLRSRKTRFFSDLGLFYCVRFPCSFWNFIGIRSEIVFLILVIISWLKSVRSPFFIFWHIIHLWISFPIRSPYSCFRFVPSWISLWLYVLISLARVFSFSVWILVF